MKKFGAIKSLSDHRDYIYGQMVPVGAVPEKFLLNEFPVRDQGQWGSCVGQAASGVKDYQECEQYGREVLTSPLFVYSECKKLDGIPNEEGTYPKTAMQVLKNLGVCRENTMPYSWMTDKITPPTPTEAYDEAKEFVIGAYAQVNTLAEVKQAIMREGPVLGAIYVVENFMEPEPGGFVPMPNGWMLGGHAVVVTGWDDNLTHTYKKSYQGETIRKGFLRVRNSWGASWGDNGHCWIPYDFFHGRTTDFGMPFWMESWSSVDVLLPPKDASRIIIVPGQDFALVNGVQVAIDQPAEINHNSNRTMMPLRFVSENMGWHVHWDGKQVIMTKEG